MELSLLLTDDDQLRQLNRDYRGRDETTDVLSFPMQEGDGAELAMGLLGDIVISVEQALRQAPSGEVEGELAVLVAHGVCHLLGLDHGTARDRRVMAAREAYLLEAAGISGVSMASR